MSFERIFFQGLILLLVQPIPALLEIPSKEHPYDAGKDSILTRVSGMLGGEDA